MDMTTQIQSRAEELGIQFSHYDIEGRLIYANPDSLAYFTELLSQTPYQNAHHRDNQNNHQNKSAVRFDDVFFAQENEPISYPVERLNLPSPPQAIKHAVLLNEQHQPLASISLSEPYLSLPSLPFGYYLLQLATADKTYHVRLLVSPKTAYQAEILQQQKVWGLNVQLYSLRSDRNWGIGDFADLAYLVEQGVIYGAEFIGINPLHAMYSAVPEWASPYSANSRRYLNWLYLAIDELPEFKLCKSVQNWLKQAEVQEKISALRQNEQVNYAEILPLKLTALEKLYAYFQRSRAAKMQDRQKAFKDFVQQKGKGLLYQGLFEVLDQQATHQHKEDEQHIGWLGWQKYQQLNDKQRDKLVRQHKENVMFYCWLQWLTHEQLSEVQKLCRHKGMSLGIYGDLAVSSSRGSADVWADPDLYCIQASVGAPPDPLGPVGQNWNIPPYNPTELKARGFQPFIELLRANMQYFGVLRIDHIMGLFRLWLIPPEKTAADGLYVHYPFAELMAILAIESQRNQCLIVGEDLGTVPDEVRWKLNEFQIFSYFVLYFEKQGLHYPDKKTFPQNAFATIGTHDVPSLASFWHCRDLAHFDQLGILEGEVLKQKYDQRLLDKQALLNSLHRDQYLPDDYWGDALTMAMHQNLMRVIHLYLAESQTKLIGVQLENLIEQEISFNLPGTSMEYPNWRMKLARTIEDIFSDENITALLTEINQARQR
ncbi:4-alpha-glucanotransferase [Avibacterium paragallinarum]|nr:4-alpha-glucanotransferase [Avibacterium paragallinarum]KAA6208783.1 4-alpha-glucanotransferase [Avibacterium paragallinarum]KKB01349.1 4-alpha-glucanotransferase [Avibacterium paragallinarum]RZN70642.1 4-alpha-glucanotransferase [Avibacterium paragallinarum]